MVLAAQWHVGSSQIKGRTCVSCIERWTPHHWAIREVSEKDFWNSEWTGRQNSATPYLKNKEALNRGHGDCQWWWHHIHIFSSKTQWNYQHPVKSKEERNSESFYEQLVAQSYQTLCDPMDCSMSGSSVHGIFQARILEWVAISFSTFTRNVKMNWNYVWNTYHCWLWHAISCYWHPPNLALCWSKSAEDEMVGWHHQLNGHEFEQTPRDGEAQRSLVCYSPWDHKELDMTERLNSKHKSVGVVMTSQGALASLALMLSSFSLSISSHWRCQGQIIPPAPTDWRRGYSIRFCPFQTPNFLFANSPGFLSPDCKHGWPLTLYHYPSPF